MARKRLIQLTASSASPGNAIFWLCCIPFSTCTSSTFFACIIFLPLHCEHLSLSLMTSPVTLWVQFHLNINWISLFIEWRLEKQTRCSKNLIHGIQYRYAEHAGPCQVLLVGYLSLIQYPGNHNIYQNFHFLNLSW